MKINASARLDAYEPFILDHMTGAPLLFEDGEWKPPIFDDEAGFISGVRQVTAASKFRGSTVFHGTYESESYYFVQTGDFSRLAYYCLVKDYPTPSRPGQLRFYPDGVSKELLKPIRVQKEVAYNPELERIIGLADHVFREHIMSSKWNACTDNQQSASARRFWQRNTEPLMADPSFELFGVEFATKEPRQIVEVWPSMSEKRDISRFFGDQMYSTSTDSQKKRILISKR
jgi:hypothetical protein